MPKVSIIIPTYNRAHLICRAINSIFAQTFKDYEIIIIDDGSKDNTKEVLQTFHEKIRYFYQDNWGISSARNRGIKEAKGEFIAFLDSDDTWVPDKLAIQTAVLKDLRSVGLVFSKMNRLDEHGKLCGIKPENPTGRNFKELLEIGGDIPTSTVMARRECFDKVGFFDESLPVMEDFEMWLRIAEHYDIYTIEDKNLADYYHHAQQITKDNVQVYDGTIKLHQKILSYYDDAPVELTVKRIAENEYVLSRIYYKKKYYQQAFSLALSSVKHFPLVGLIFINKTDPVLIRFIKFIKPYLYIFLCSLSALSRFSKDPVEISRKKRKPTVSIIVPVFNRVKYLEQSIDSILKQNYADFEIIIVDDGSTENIKEVLIKCVNKSPSKVRFIRQNNRGPAGARNKGIKEALGKYIAFLDADDEWEKDFLSKCIEQLKIGNYKWLDTAAFRVVIDDNETVLQKTVIHGESIDGIKSLFPLLLKDNIIGSPSKVIIEKDCFKKVGYFREDLRIREDWEMWLRLAKAHFSFHRITEPLYQYKIRQNSLTKTETSTGLLCTYKLLCEYCHDAFKQDASNRVLYAEMMWDIARHILNSKDKNFYLFFKSILKSQLYDPSLTRILKSFKSFKTRYV